MKRRKRKPPLWWDSNCLLKIVHVLIVAVASLWAARIAAEYLVRHLPL
jgi:hypothetical protein